VKVAFIVSGKSSFSMPGGLGAYAYNTCQIMNQLGYQVYLISFSDKNETKEMEFGTLVHVKTPYNFLASLGIFFIVPFLVKTIQAILKELNDTSEILIFGAGIWAITGTQLKSRLVTKTKIPIHTLAGYFTTYQHEYEGQVKGSPARDYGLMSNFFVKSINYFARLFFVPIEQKMLKSVDRIIVHYESTKNILISEIKGLDAKKVIKIPYYINIYDRQSNIGITSSENDQVRVSVICRQDPRKGINSFLHAVKILKEKNIDCSCMVAGAGFFFKNNQALAKKLQVNDRVEFPGFIESVDEALENTDIFVLPSVEEGSGAIAILEAMKKGIAIITTRCDGMPEDFEQDETGILVEMDNPQQLAQALERLILDKELRDKLALNVRNDYSKRFSFQKMKEGVAEVIETLNQSLKV